MKCNWQEVEPNYWWAIIAGHSLHVYPDPKLSTPEQPRWIAKIEAYGSLEEYQQPEWSTHEEVREMLEHALFRLIGDDARILGAAYVTTLVEKKWGISTNNFIPLTFTSLLDAMWSEMYIPQIGRCFVAESKTQWTWLVAMDNGGQASGTAKSLHEAKRESVLAAMTMYHRSLIHSDYDTLWMRAFRGLPNAELQKVQ